MIINFLGKLENHESSKWRELRRIRALFNDFERLNLTSIEYAYLKLIAVFNPSQFTGKKIRKIRRVERFNRFNSVHDRMSTLIQSS